MVSGGGRGRVERVLTGPLRREPLNASALRVRFAVVRASGRNLGLVHVGDASIIASDPGLGPGRTLGLRGGPTLDLSKVFALADVGGDRLLIDFFV